MPNMLSSQLVLSEYSIWATAFRILLAMSTLSGAPDPDTGLVQQRTFLFCFPRIFYFLQEVSCLWKMSFLVKASPQSHPPKLLLHLDTFCPPAVRREMYSHCSRIDFCHPTSEPIAVSSCLTLCLYQLTLSSSFLDHIKPCPCFSSPLSAS